MEPLKNKKKRFDGYSASTFAYEQKDVSSAVEWLKKEILKFPKEGYGAHYKDRSIRLINLAFEDVTK